MREQLIQYVNLLFAGNDDADDIRMEILQNTLDRYDDLIDQGLSEETAYRTAITGIGDLSGILGGQNASYARDASNVDIPLRTESDEIIERLIRAVAIGLYIISPIPLILFDWMGADVIGLCCTLVLVAVATILLLVFRKKTESIAAEQPQKQTYTKERKDTLRKSIDSIISSFGLVLYFLISFTTHAWGITWLIFPLIGAVQGLVHAILDLKGE